MTLSETRNEVHEILSRIDGLDPKPAWPEGRMDGPTCVYTRINTNSFAPSTSGDLDELVAYTLEVVTESLYRTEAFADEINVEMTEAGYDLVDASQTGPQSCTLIYSRTRDRQSKLTHGRG